MSMRTIARSSSKRKSASALASSVLPVPVGPRNRNEPVGRFGSEMPARERRTASLTALHGVAAGRSAAAPMTVSISSSLAVSPCEHPAGRDAGPGLDDLGDLLGADLLADQRLESSALLGRPRRPRSASPARGSTVVDLAGRLEVALAQQPVGLDRAAGRAGGAARPRPRARPSRAPSGPRARAAPPRGRRGRRAAGRAARPTPSSVSLVERELLHLQPVDAGGGAGRSPPGEDSISIRSREAASSMRSIALSGSWRPVM